MASEFVEIHDELRGVARDLLTETSTGGGADSAPVAVDWSLLGQSGWLGLEVAEEFGGAGVTFAEVAVVLHEMGRAAALSSYLGGVVLSVGALNLLEASPARDGLLAGAASGEMRVAVALAAGDRDVAPFTLSGAGNGLTLDGRAEFVPDAADADHLLLLATDPAGVPVLVHLERGSSAIEVTDQPVLDETRRFAVVAATGGAIEANTIVRFSGDPEAAAGQLRSRAALAIACDSLGVAEAMLEAAVSYVGVRHQFDRAIGSFQAVKHACADMLVQITIGRELLSAAIEALSEGRPDAAVEVARAKSYICAASVDVVGEAMQLHGGMGYTWESGIHVYLKRAVLDRSLFGAPGAHRRSLAQRFV
jgi:alkylation response protein AidB-like acyl-CoA dehydrogenase